MPACPDYQIAGNMCCKKYICLDGCIYKCPKGHENKSYDNDGWRSSIECEICQEKFEPKFYWEGISLPEHHERYGSVFHEILETSASLN